MEESQREGQVRECARLVEDMVRALVDRPDSVAIQVVSGAQAVIFEVSVDPEDVRRIIGRKGRATAPDPPWRLNEFRQMVYRQYYPWSAPF